MPDASITIVGNATADPVLAYSQAGNAYTRFNIAVNKRVKNGDQWEDGEPSFYNVTAFGDMGENVAETIAKGMRVIVIGSIEVRQYQKDDGTKGTSVDLIADFCGPDLKWASAVVTRNERKS